MNAIVIELATSFPAGVTEVAAESRLEGFDFVDRLVREWGSGENMFAGEGEALFVARIDRWLVGFCGVNRDPYLNDATVGRLRHLYVAQRVRRSGIGRKLVDAVLQHAPQHFLRIRLRTNAAAGFYDRLGFRQSSEADATHEVSRSRNGWH